MTIIPRAARIAAALTAMAMVLSACGSLLPSPGPAPHLYTLTPKSTFRDDLPTATWQRSRLRLHGLARV